jgi:putative FmdB family regulatory protein
MPLYEYECFVCNHRFERIQRVADAAVVECPECGGAVHRLLGVPALQFKGSGWYVTDYGKNNGGRSTALAKTEDPSPPSTTAATAKKEDSTKKAD